VQATSANSGSGMVAAFVSARPRAGHGRARSAEDAAYGTSGDRRGAFKVADARLAPGQTSKAAAEGARLLKRPGRWLSSPWRSLPIP